ncbi:MAG: CoA transferase [Emcibacter sp.]|nr:CoA transferase [Emcibacter sp.]
MGALDGIKIIELVGLGPGPFAGMMLADMGAEVIAIDRLERGAAPRLAVDLNRRGKKSIILDLKSGEGREIFFKLCRTADGLIEGFRPGVMEKLGLGPDDCAVHNPKLVYGRMTGWGQHGPLAQAAGHDLNYIALSGALHAMGHKDQPPMVPLNLVGDYGGGAMMLAFGLLCALLEAQKSGTGQVVDASMVEGSSLLMTLFHSLKASGMWQPERQANLLDGAAPFYDCYQCRDGLYISIGAIELPFMGQLVDKAGLPTHWLESHMNTREWPARKKIMAALFMERRQQEWCDLLEGTDACFAPVLPFWQAKDHRHNIARNSFIDVEGINQPAPAPRFSRTGGQVKWGPVTEGQHSQEILSALGMDNEEISRMMEQKIVQ